MLFKHGMDKPDVEKGLRQAHMLGEEANEGSIRRIFSVFASGGTEQYEELLNAIQRRLKSQRNIDVIAKKWFCSDLCRFVKYVL